MAFLHVNLKNNDKKKYNIKIDARLVLTTNATLALLECFIQQQLRVFRKGHVSYHVFL